MDLNFNNKLEEYYQKFIELQEKLKKSEEQRFMMEMKFNEMVQVAKEEEQAHYRKLRAQYKKFLEEDLKRQDRNEHIIRNLERIEAKISMLSAKTERISMFRSQYQKYLHRIANSYPDKKITDSKISRERSFIKEEPLKEQQPIMFRDDYSVPARKKDTTINTDKVKSLYEHPSVMKSLEKEDRSNEEKIEILDRYLQSISSQRCRDVLNQERQARDKLSFDTPIDKLFANDFSSHSTNHATAVADDIMNSIYSRYYAKAEVTPKGNKVDLPKDMQNGNNGKSDFIKQEFRPEDKPYLNTMYNKTTHDPLENNNPTVTFKKEEILLQPKENREATVAENTSGDKSNDFKNTFNEAYNFQDKNKQEVLPEVTDPKQDLVNHVAENDIRNDMKNYNNSIDHTSKLTINDLKIETKQNEKALTNGLNKNDVKSLINSEREFNNNLPVGNNMKETNGINEDPRDNIQLEENRNILPHDPSSGMIENTSPQILPHDESEYSTLMENKSQRNDQMKEQTQEQFLKSQEEEQRLEYVPNDSIYPTEEPYYPEGPSEQFNQQNQDELYNKTTNDNKNNLTKLDTNSNNQNGQLTGHDEAYDNQDQPPLEYNQNNESGQPIQYDPLGEQPYDQNQHYENDQPNQYNPSDQPPLQYDDNFAQPAQFVGTGQPTEFVENDPSYQPIQYDENGRQSIQYDENGQPIGYDQYGQPLMYDQNGQIVQPQYDENGQLVPQYDENGQIMMLYDHNGQLLFDDQYKSNQQYDLDGQSVQYDENGQPIYDQNQQQYYGYTNQEQADPASGYNQYQGEEQRQYTASQEEQINVPLENTENQFQTEESSNNYNQVGDQQGSYPNPEVGQVEGGDQNQHGTEYDHQGQENTGAMQDVNNEQNVEGQESEVQNNEIAKSNIMDILDTDTESAKQNASKISNESDFDFS